MSLNSIVKLTEKLKSVGGDIKVSDVGRVTVLFGPVMGEKRRVIVVTDDLMARQANMQTALVKIDEIAASLRSSQ